MAAREAINDDRALIRLERRMIHYARLYEMLENTPTNGLLHMPRQQYWPTENIEEQITELQLAMMSALYSMFIYWRYGPDADISDFMGDDMVEYQRHFEESLRNQSPDPFFGLYQ